MQQVLWTKNEQSFLLLLHLFIWIIFQVILVYVNLHFFFFLLIHAYIVIIII